MESSERGDTPVTKEMGERCLINAHQVAEMIGMRVDYVYELAKRGEIPHQRFGRTLRFRRGAIEDWLREREEGSKAAA